MNKLVSRSFFNALGTAVYITALAEIFFNIQRIFGNKPDNVTDPIIVLMVFVISAAVTGGLVLGKPVLMYLDNQKADAIRLFIYTVCWLVLGVVILFLFNVLK